MRKQKRIWAYLLSAAMVVTSFTMSSTTGKAEGTTEKGKIVSVMDRTSTKKAASETEIGKIASVTNKVSTKKTAGTDSFQDLNRQQITEAMGVGYNLGNSLEANSGGTPNETAWGNPVLSKEFVLAAKAAGFLAKTACKMGAHKKGKFFQKMALGLYGKALGEDESENGWISYNKENVKAYDENMEEFILEGTELLARAICHELDHLDGHM